MEEMYADPTHAEETFDENNLSEYLLQAQWSEFVELKRAITEVHQKTKRPLYVLDIGIGNARVPKHLSGIDEIWRMIQQYDGIDVAQNCVDISKNLACTLHIDDKVSVKLLDATNLNQLGGSYDLIISTWFTAGNFFPFQFDFETFKSGYDMSRNEKFEAIFQQAYSKLNTGGEIMIPSVVR